MQLIGLRDLDDLAASFHVCDEVYLYCFVLLQQPLACVLHLAASVLEDDEAFSHPLPPLVVFLLQAVLERPQLLLISDLFIHAAVHLLVGLTERLSHGLHLSRQIICSLVGSLDVAQHVDEFGSQVHDQLRIVVRALVVAGLWINDGPLVDAL